MRSVVTSWAMVLCVCAASALGQISPTPVINNEIREADSVRMRAVQLERIQRDVGRGTRSRPVADEDAELQQIREDFERIQKLQDEIVRVYRTSRTIDFRRIELMSSEMSKRAVRLESMLFGIDRTKHANETKAVRTVRELIIKLDGAIGRFVAGPIFNDPLLVDSTSAERSQRDLQLIANLSAELVRSAAVGR